MQTGQRSSLVASGRLQAQNRCFTRGPTVGTSVHG